MLEPMVIALIVLILVAFVFGNKPAPATLAQGQGHPGAAHQVGMDPVRLLDPSYKILPDRNIRATTGVSDGFNKEFNPLDGLNTTIQVARFDPGTDTRPYLPYGHKPKPFDRPATGDRAPLGNTLTQFARDQDYFERSGEADDKANAVLRQLNRLQVRAPIPNGLVADAPQPDMVISKKDARPQAVRQGIPGLGIGVKLVSKPVARERRGIKTYDWTQFDTAQYPVLPVADAPPVHTYPQQFNTKVR